MVKEGGNPEPTMGELAPLRLEIQRKGGPVYIFWGPKVGSRYRLHTLGSNVGYEHAVGPNVPGHQKYVR